MMHTNFPLVEKTALFWHGHFATHIDNPYYDQQILNIFRKQGLGHFGELLKSVSTCPAMLLYLNNQQNRKMHPNENFAREVLELFTLGRGNYTETDIWEAARAFTGWGIDEDGNFKFRENQHDSDLKTFFGTTDNYDGFRILDRILEQPQTSIFITTKIYRFFVSDTYVNNKHIDYLAKEFYNSGYNITHLLKTIFRSDWFYDDDLAGEKIKSPIELLIGYQRTIPLDFNNDQMLIRLQKAMGQYLFNPPNVAGWSGGKSWINTSSLLFRMRLPEALYASGDLTLEPKESGNEMVPGAQKDNLKDKLYKMGKVVPDWTAYLDHWNDVPVEKLPEAIADFLFTFKLTPEQLAETSANLSTENKEEFIKVLTIRLMERPEYQLI
jgi:uncharacterized protein (DUF1800 family)